MTNTIQKRRELLTKISISGEMTNWTPIEKQEFPESTGYYFVTVRDGSLGHCYTRPAHFIHLSAWEDMKRDEVNKWKFDGLDNETVIAWMPMKRPTPFDPRDSND